MHHGAGAVAMVLFVGATFLALTPFHDGAVRCGAPLLGADPSLPDAPSGAVPTPPPTGSTVLVLPGTCRDEGSLRLVLAVVLLIAGAVTTAIGLRLGRGADARRTVG
jgi:hypothetical protein